MLKKKPNAQHIVYAAGIVTEVLLELKRLTKPGASLGMLDEIAERMILSAGAKPFIKGYQPEWAKEPYPATICASVDEEVCHAPPGMRELEEGNIVTYDLAVKYKTACGDAALTVPVGYVSNKKQRLMRYAERAMMAGIEQIKAGVAVSMIGASIEISANMNGYQVIKDYGGHGIGRNMHEAPLIPNFHHPDNDKVFLKEGQIVCIEPMLTTGKAEVGILGTDGWTAFTLDNQPVAMFEHMVMVTKVGYKILTKHLVN